MFDSGSEKDAHALDRLRRDVIGWLTTVTPDGQPQTFPIWFLWDDGPGRGRGEILIYSDRRARRNRNIAANPRVSLHLDDDGAGSDVVIVEGEARVDHSVPALPDNDAYLAKYRERIVAAFDTPQEMATIYNVPLRIRPTRGITF